MTTIQIKQVPAETHSVLRQRAEASGQSLQEYMLALIVQEASMPTTDEWLDEVEDGPLVALDPSVITDIVHADRDRH